jgi:hypothetical protein
MSDQPNEPNGQNNGNPSGDQARTQQEPGKCILDSLTSAMRKGAEDARKAAEEAIPKVKAAASDAAYWMAYGVSFAAVFQWTVAKSFTPECVKSGYRDGVKAGREAAEKWVDTVKHPKPETTATASPPQTGPPAECAQPRVA